MPSDPNGLRVGIAITTLNRRDLVCAQIAELRRQTSCPFDLVVCDDGSSDETPATIRAMGEAVIAGVNRGTAWNKNRGIFYLMAVRGCDVAILLDDDVLPTTQGWEIPWIENARRIGHVNFAYPAMLAAESGPADTKAGAAPTLLGCCIAFHRYAWSMVGYMNSKFGRYGHEHTEYTDRFLRCGFGGIQADAIIPNGKHYSVLTSGIHLVPTQSHGTPEDAAANATIWTSLINQAGHTYCPPWADERQRIEFLSEIRLALRHHPSDVPLQSDEFIELR